MFLQSWCVRKNTDHFLYKPIFVDPRLSASTAITQKYSDGFLSEFWEVDHAVIAMGAVLFFSFPPSLK